jgi:membrane protein DedA with SNARE-associated domain
MDFAELLPLFLLYKYPIIFLVAVVEGPIIMAMSGVLVHLGLASFWPIYFILMAGDLVSDIFWYGIGYHFTDPLTSKYGKYFRLTPELIGKTKKIFQKHPVKILFFSKITMGLGLPLATLMIAGMSKIPFKKYLGSLLLGQFIFTGALISVGYFFGNLYETLGQDIKIISMISFVAVIVLILFGVKSYFRNKKEEIINENI